jgi:hypothetical protein
MATIFRRTEYDDGVGSMFFIDACLSHDLGADVKQKPNYANGGYR